LTHQPKLHLFAVVRTNGEMLTLVSWPQMWFKVTDQLNERWQSDWILQAFWQVLNGGILAVICYLWAPTHNATRSVYTSEMSAAPFSVASTGQGVVRLLQPMTRGLTGAGLQAAVPTEIDKHRFS
jgi:hypothetical protein